MNVKTTLPRYVYGIKPAYVSIGLERIYHKALHVVRFVFHKSSNTYEPDELYDYTTSACKTKKARATGFSAKAHLIIHDTPSTAPAIYKVNYSLFANKDIAYISKIQGIEEIKKSYTAELKRLQELFNNNVPNTDLHKEAIQAIKEEYPEKFI